jgi:lysylphosphatidylglycerol synthetase-like protein (DUF2156 family)
LTLPSGVPDLLEVDVAVGGRAMVVANLHLRGDPTPGQLAAAGELSDAIAAATGPGVLVVAGNLLDSPTGGPAPDAFAAALAAHPRLCQAISAYAAGDGRRVVILPGDRDARLAAGAGGVVADRLGAELALAAALRIHTGSGDRLVRVDPGQRFDPLCHFADPRNPLESPYGTHLREEILPGIRRRSSTAGRRDRRPWLAGVEALDDAGALSRFVASRLVYRRLAAFAWLLLGPVVAAFVLGLPAAALRSARHGGLTSRLGLFTAGTLIELLLLVLVAVSAIRVTNRALGAVAQQEAVGDPNGAARAAARELVTGGWTGMVTGHTCRPELVALGPGFYANPGAGADVVSEYPTRVPGLGLPPVFFAHRMLSWVELEAGPDLRVRLRVGDQDLPGASLAERVLASRERAPGTLRPAALAEWPAGAAWPPRPSRNRRDRRVRRTAAAVLVAVGFLSLVSAVSDPVADRLGLVRDLFPIAVPQTAAAVTAVFGVAFIMLARSIRRGLRRAWAAAETLLVVVAVLHLLKGIDAGESILALVVAGGLYMFRDSFAARADVLGLGRGLASVLGAALLVVAAGTLAIELSTVIAHSRHPGDLRIPWGRALQATLYRMVGQDTVPLPRRVNDFAEPTLGAATVGLTVALLGVLFRPVVARSLRRAGDSAAPPDGGGAPTTASGAGEAAAGTGAPAGASRSGRADLERARAVVARYGWGTLDYFALRPDKRLFFSGDTLVAYAVYGGVCLVSPDPVGPPAERDAAWQAFRHFADLQGWNVGVLGAGEDWLPIYRDSGMHCVYVGDEAVVRVDRFSLDGGRFKGLRQAVNRVAKYGYTISFCDPATVDPALRRELEEVMTKSRRGDVERGFSMTLGRVFDPDDRGLLMAVVHAPAPEGGRGKAVAFCQYVPAPGIGGYSLDLMRRDDGDHPNGLTDFAVVQTIWELRTRGHDGLGLNFATMRAVLAGEAGEGRLRRAQAWVLRRLGGSMQIESLWRFNAKFDPDWQPRYALYDAPENALAVAVAVARAESFWELPVIGRWLVPAGAGPLPGRPETPCG